MKVAYQQLEQHLSKPQPLAPIYLISSDEPLLASEAIATIRTAALKQGFSERISLSPEPGSDWSKQLHTHLHSMSLFSDQRFIELHLGATKPNPTTSKLLKEIASAPPSTSILVINLHKLDSKAEQTAWFKAIDKSGVTMTIWPLTLEQLPQWIMMRVKKTGFTITPDAAKLLATLVEGNSLAAAQELEKLCLLFKTPSQIDSATIEKAVVDNARFDIFSLVECALSGNAARSMRILKNLQAEEAEPVLVLWALTRELRMLADLARHVKQGVALSSLFSQYRIWEKRQAGVRRFLQHHSLASCFTLVAGAAEIDRIIKGAAPGNAWDALAKLTVNMAGLTLFVE